MLFRSARFAGGLDTERGPLGLSSRAPRSAFKEAASQGFLEAVSFYYSPRPMFRPVISASSSSLRSLPAPGWLFGPALQASPLIRFPVLLFLPALASFLGLALQSSPWSASLFPCPPVLARFSQLFWSRAPVIPQLASLFPCPCPSQVSLSGRLFCIFLWLVLIIGHKGGNFFPHTQKLGEFWA